AHVAGAGVAVGGVAADPQPWDRRGQPRDRLAGPGPPPRGGGGGRPGGSPRWVRGEESKTGVKQPAREPGELILGARWKVPRGPGSFSKIGSRNAMVIAVANLCLQVDEAGRSVRVALGSVAPTVVRAEVAETF